MREYKMTCMYYCTRHKMDVIVAVSAIFVIVGEDQLEPLPKWNSVAANSRSKIDHTWAYPWP